MKNLTVIVSSALVISALAARATPETVVLTQNADSFAVGGEFNANTSQNFLGQYSPKAIVGTGFETFCIETTVDFYPGQTYTYTLSSVDSLGRDLTKGAAYLYKEFATGKLSGYDYTGSGRNGDAGDLQAAIWWLQGGQTYGGYPDPTTDSFYEDAITALGGTLNAELPDYGHSGVDVLQLWNGTTAAQNQLVLVPDSGTTAGLFAMGLSAMGLMRRRFKAA